MSGLSENVEMALNWAGEYASCRKWASRERPATMVGRAPVDDIDIYYRRYGEGDAVLLLHGGFLCAEAWSAQVPAIASRYQPVVMDSRGHGRTTLGIRELTYRRLAADAAGLLEKLGLVPAHVVGWSDGGCAAIALALEHQDAVRSLTLIGTPFSTDNYTPAGLEYMESLLRPGSLDMLPLRLIWRLLNPEPRRWGEFLDAMREMWRNLPDFSASDLAGILAPTLVLACDRDEFLARPGNPLEVFERTARAIPGARMYVIEGGTHFATIGKPGAVNAAVLDFLDGLAGSRDRLA